MSPSGQDRLTTRGGGKDADTVALERRVTDALGLEVTIDHRGEAGVVHVRYRRGSFFPPVVNQDIASRYLLPVAPVIMLPSQKQSRSIPPFV